MSDQRALLDGCTVSVECTSDMHLMCCPSTDGRTAVAEPRPERQTWERPVRVPSPGPRVAATRIHLEVNAGVVEIHESVLAQLLLDAGWERTA